MNWEQIFIQHRPYLLSLGFRMTGSLAESEDIVQDTFVSCMGTDPGEIQNHRAWLTRVCTNKALDYLKVAHKKRESYVGVWLPDAVPDSFQFWGNLEDPALPGDELLRRESLTMSFLLMLQKLSPEERVVYLLNEVFNYSLKEISDFLQKTEEAIKKISQRARKAFDNEKRFRNDGPESEKVISKFFEIAKTGNAEALAGMLSPESEFWSDSGGKVPAASKSVIYDIVRTSRFLAGIWSSKPFLSDSVRWEVHTVNSRPGLIVSAKTPEGHWKIDSILTFEVENGKIARIYTQRNPDKLKLLMSER